MNATQFLFPRSIRLVRRDPMVLVPSVALGLVTTLAKLWLPGFFVQGSKLTDTAVVALLVVLVASEFVRYLTISWAVQLSQSRRIDVLPADPIASLVKLFHLVLLLTGIALLGGGLALFILLTSQSAFIMIPALVLGIGIGLVALLASNFIVVESLSVWRALVAAARLIQQSFGLLVRVMLVSMIVAFGFGALSESFGQLPAVGVIVSGVIAGVGSGISVLVQTIGFLDIRSRYRSVQ